MQLCLHPRAHNLLNTYTHASRISHGPSHSLTARVPTPQDGTLVFCAGGVVHFLDLHTMTQSYLPSIGGNEIGCVEVHTERKLICVAEKGEMPNVFLYDYPSLRLRRVLRNGTERAYSAANFSSDGSKLATVGSFPDYMITVWDWEKEVRELTHRERERVAAEAGARGAAAMS